jgi:hypothetical protein
MPDAERRSECAGLGKLAYRKARRDGGRRDDVAGTQGPGSRSQQEGGVRSTAEGDQDAAQLAEPRLKP